MTVAFNAYFEVSPLFDEHWTGIPAVVAGLAAQAMEDSDINWTFVYENILLEREVVSEILRRRSGGAYLSYLEQRLFDNKVICADDAVKGVCIYTNVKALRKKFKREALILHDFSPLLTPEFHHSDTINHHANRVLGDVHSSDFFLCVSRATAEDLVSYFAVPRASIEVLPMGIAIDPCFITDWLRSQVSERAESYICVLGTIEPRKNGLIVLDLIHNYPEILLKYKIVFVGRDGWNDEKQKLMKHLANIGIDVSRIIFSGFVSESKKVGLMLGSRFCIYPSYFEGFGIPVAEAAALGKFVICSNSSSLTEVAPDMSFFFEPNDVESLADAFQKAEEAVALSRLNKMRFPDIWDRVQSRSWERGYALIRGWVKRES